LAPPYIGGIGKESVRGIGNESVNEDSLLGNEVPPPTESPKRAGKKLGTALALQALLLNLPPWVDREAWEAYLEMRRALKKPMTAAAFHLTISRLQSFDLADDVWIAGAGSE